MKHSSEDLREMHTLVYGKDGKPGAWDQIYWICQAEDAADADASRARCIPLGQTEDGIPIVEDPIPQEHPTQRYFREGALFALRELATWERDRAIAALEALR